MTGQIQETESPQSNVNNLQIDLEQFLNSNIKINHCRSFFQTPVMTTKHFYSLGNNSGKTRFVEQMYNPSSDCVAPDAREDFFRA